MKNITYFIDHLEIYYVIRNSNSTFDLLFSGSYKICRGDTLYQLFIIVFYHDIIQIHLFDPFN